MRQTSCKRQSVSFTSVANIAGTKMQDRYGSKAYSVPSHNHACLFRVTATLLVLLSIRRSHCFWATATAGRRTARPDMRLRSANDGSSKLVLLICALIVAASLTGLYIVPALRSSDLFTDSERCRGEKVVAARFGAASECSVRLRSLSYCMPGWCRRAWRHRLSHDLQL